jgi:VWFA-related protein
LSRTVLPILAAAVLATARADSVEYASSTSRGNAIRHGRGDAQGQPSFRSTVDLVTVPVTVTARDPLRRVSDLGTGDFRIFEDGVLQQVTVVSHEPQPVSLCILLDSSPSMASGRQALAISTIDTLIGDLGPDDEAALLFFAAKVRVVLPWTPARAIKPISWLQWHASLGTSLIDALKEALDLVGEARNPVPVIVIVSDGGELSSRMPLAKLVATRRQSETLVYGIHTDLPPTRRAPSVNRAFANFLPDLVGDSGGAIFHVTSPESGAAAARALLEELRSQYTLGYVPTRALDGTYRQLKVDASNPALAVRHRGGYLAVPH